ncbi:MAG: hypothetical protein AAF486_04080 [Pseudomonadota bacterium]
MDQRDQDSLDWSFDYAARRLDSARALAFPAGRGEAAIQRGAWRAACSELRYLEMMVRRLLICLAGAFLDGPWRSPRKRGAPPRAPTKPCAGDPRRPSFALNERLMSPAQVQAALFGRPVIPKSADTRQAPWADAPEPPPVVDARRLAARFAALARVLAGPEPYARAYARRVRRAWHPASGGIGVRLRPRARPGPARRTGRATSLSLERSAFEEAERLSLLTLNRPLRVAPPGPPG